MPRNFSRGDIFDASQIWKEIGEAGFARKLAKEEAARQEREQRNRDTASNLDLMERETALPYRQEARRAGYGGDVRAHGRALVEAEGEKKARELILTNTIGLVKSGVLTEEEGPRYAQMRLTGQTANDALDEIQGARPAGSKAETSTERDRAIAIYRDPNADPADKELAGIYLGKIPRARHEPAGSTSTLVRPSARGRVAGLGEAGTPKRDFFEAALREIIEPGGLLVEPTTADSMAIANAAERVTAETPDKLNAEAKGYATMLMNIAYPTGDGTAVPSKQLRSISQALALAPTQTERDRILEEAGLLDDDDWDVKAIRKHFQVKK